MRHFLLWLFILLCACTKSSETGQVVALVNGEEISGLQYAGALKAAGIATDKIEVRKILARKLVDRELAVQKAVANGMDRDADVMQRIEEAKRDILARAYAKKLIESLPVPDEQSIAAYYSAHPELFSARKLFMLEEKRFELDVGRVSSAKAFLRTTPNMVEFERWFGPEANAKPWQRNVRAAERLPMETLKKLNQSGPGDMAYFVSSNGLLLYRVLNLQEASLNLEQARPSIMHYLKEKEANAVLEREMQHLRRNANIEYFGDFKLLMTPQIVSD